MYFSGFCFHNEEVLFESFLIKRGIYDICGFSFGAQKAMDLAYRRIRECLRVNRLILLSPAIFQNKSQAYKKLQINAFKKDPKSYVENFLRIAGVDEKIMPYTRLGNLSELEELLEYVWEESILREVINHGVEIEIYLGGKDKIIDSSYALDFFAPYGRICLIKSANHCLKF